jgi:hypothetical protein
MMVDSAYLTGLADQVPSLLLGWQNSLLFASISLLLTHFAYFKLPQPICWKLSSSPKRCGREDILLAEFINKKNVPNVHLLAWILRRGRRLKG